jgi:hypothetical protein
MEACQAIDRKRSPPRRNQLNMTTVKRKAVQPDQEVKEGAESPGRLAVKIPAPIVSFLGVTGRDRRSSSAERRDLLHLPEDCPFRGTNAPALHGSQSCIGGSPLLTGQAFPSPVYWRAHWSQMATPFPEASRNAHAGCPIGCTKSSMTATG